MKKDKFKATGIHLVISLVIAAIILVLLYWFWFPPPLIGLGAAQGVQLILIVDLVVGPLCTLIVYRKGKPGMVVDLVTIGLLQIAAITYGLWAVYTQKPSYMVFTYDGLELVSRFDEQRFVYDEGRSVEDMLRASTIRYEGMIPVFFFPEVSEDFKRGGNRIEFELNEGAPYYFDSDRYEPINSLAAVPYIGAGVFDKEHNCYSISITSPHGQTETCIAEQNGEIVQI